MLELICEWRVGADHDASQGGGKQRSMAAGVKKLTCETEQSFRRQVELLAEVVCAHEVARNTAATR